MKILVTGAVGLLDTTYQIIFLKKIKVVGIDNMDDYYSIKLKKKEVSSIKKIKILNFSKLIFHLINYKKTKKI